MLVPSFLRNVFLMIFSWLVALQQLYVECAPLLCRCFVQEHKLVTATARPARTTCLRGRRDRKRCSLAYVLWRVSTVGGRFVHILPCF